MSFKGREQDPNLASLKEAEKRKKTRPLTPKEAIRINLENFPEDLKVVIDLILIGGTHRDESSRKRKAEILYTDLIKLIEDLQLPLEDIRKNNWCIIRCYYSQCGWNVDNHYYHLKFTAQTAWERGATFVGLINKV